MGVRGRGGKLSVMKVEALEDWQTGKSAATVTHCLPRTSDHLTKRAVRLAVSPFALKTRKTRNGGLDFGGPRANIRL